MTRRMNKIRPTTPSANRIHPATGLPSGQIATQIAVPIMFDE